MMLRLVIAFVVCVVISLPGVGRAGGDPVRGEKIYKRCTACHALDANRVGPMHRSVYGRKAGSVPGYAYSEALTASDVIWDDTTLDKWLTDPRKFVPGTKMRFRLSNPQNRADVIAFLKGQK